MSKPRFPWWGYAKNMIRKYPEMSRIRSAQQGQPSGSGGAAGSVQPSAGQPPRALSPARIREMDAVAEAIKITKEKRTGDLRMQIIQAVLWDQTVTVSEAAVQNYISESTAVRYHSEFIELVGRCYGLEDDHLDRDPKKKTAQGQTQGKR